MRYSTEGPERRCLQLFCKAKRKNQIMGMLDSYISNLLSCMTESSWDISEWLIRRVLNLRIEIFISACE